MVGHPLVDVLVVPAQQGQFCPLGIPPRICLGERPPAGGKQDDRRLGTNGVDGLEKRLWLHDHTRPSAVGRVVDRAVLVMGVVAKVDEPVFHPARRLCPGWNAQPQRPGKKFGKDRDDVDREH